MLCLLPPARLNGFFRNGSAPGRRQASGSRVSALGRAEGGEGDGGGIAGVWRLNAGRRLAGRFLGDLVGELIGITGAAA